MLQDIRDKAQGWIAWAIVILISIPFALWGIQEYLGIGSEPVVASVNGNEITERALDQRYHSFRQELREQLGAAYRPELFDDQRMRNEVLKRMVREDVILQASHQMGLRSGDPLVRQAILSIDAFRKNGQFDQETYERAVRLQGTTTNGFEERLRRILLSDQLSQGILSSAFVTDHELREHLRLENQTRDLAYFVILTADFVTDDPVSDAEVQTYYEQQQRRFRTPEQVKLEYILLNSESVGNTVDVDEAELLSFYDNNQERYGQPEQRQASHILIQLDQAADPKTVSEAQETILELRQRAEQGEDFAELAKAHSQDPGSAANGGDLGFFGKGIMDPAFEAATFSLQEGELSEPVRSGFGFHLIKLTGIKSGSVKPFAEVRAEVEKAYRKVEGERLYFELAERLADLSYEDPSSLLPAAETLQLEIQQSDWISRDGGAGVLRSPKVTAAAFSEDVLVERNNSELIELDQEQSIVLRVIDHKEAAYESIDEVKQEIEAAIQQQRASDKTKAEAEKRLVDLKAGAMIAQVAQGYELKEHKSVKRNDDSVPLALLQSVFRSQKPSEGQSVPGLSEMPNGDYAVFALNAVHDGSLDTVADTERQDQQTQLRQQKGRNQYEQLVSDLTEHTDIVYTEVKTEE